MPSSPKTGFYRPSAGWWSPDTTSPGTEHRRMTPVIPPVEWPMARSPIYNGAADRTGWGADGAMGRGRPNSSVLPMSVLGFGHDLNPIDLTTGNTGPVAGAWISPAIFTRSFANGGAVSYL